MRLKSIPPPRPNAQKLPKNLDLRAKAIYTGAKRDIEVARKAFPPDSLSLRDRFRLAVLERQDGAPLNATQEALIDEYCKQAENRAE